MRAYKGQLGARYWSLVALAAVALAASWIVGIVWAGSTALFDQLETLDLAMGIFWGLLVPVWVTIHSVWAILIRRKDHLKSERHFMLAVMAVPLILLGYGILAGWVPRP